MNLRDGEIPQTYSATQVVAMLNGAITYRMLDYWLRLGVVDIADNAIGSGSRRRFTASEVDTLRALVTEYNHLNAELDKIRDGTAWRRARRLRALDDAFAEAVS